MVTSRGNILHVMDVIEEHCTLYKLLDLGFICAQKKMQQQKQRGSECGGSVDGKNRAEQKHRYV